MSAFPTPRPQQPISAPPKEPQNFDRKQFKRNRLAQMPLIRCNRQLIGQLSDRIVNIAANRDVRKIIPPLPAPDENTATKFHELPTASACVATQRWSATKTSTAEFFRSELLW